MKDSASAVKTYLLLILTLMIMIPPSTAQDPVDIDRIVSVLDATAIRTDNGLTGWPYRIQSTLSTSDRVYNGYTVGIAGIGDFLRKAADAGYSSAEPLLDEVLTHFIDTAVSRDGLSYWYQLSGSRNPGWTGSRYGVSGIVRTMTGAQEYWEYNQTLMHSAVDWILAQRDDQGDLPISPNSYFTSGLEYGEAGVVRDLLYAYESTSDNYFLDAAEEILQNFVTRGEVSDGQLKYLWSEFGEGTQFEDLYLTGVGTGNAGIMTTFLQYYGISGNTDFLDRATQIGNFLRNSEISGQWRDNSIGYVTRSSVNDALLGYWSGSMGIASAMVRLDREENADIAARVDKLVRGMDTVFAGLSDSTQYAGIRMGAVGQAMFYLDLYEAYGGDYKTRVDEVLGNLLVDDNGLGVVVASNTEGYSVNIEEGITGLGMLLLRLQDVMEGTDDIGYSDLVEGASPLTTLVTESTASFPLAILPLLVLKRRKSQINSISDPRWNRSD